VTLNREKAEDHIGISVSISLTIKPDGKKHVTISVGILRRYPSSYPSMHYLVIEKLFGNAWQRSKFEPLGSNQVYRAPTDIHGNKKWNIRVRMAMS